MSKNTSMALVIAGVVLLLWGMSVSGSLSSKMTQFWTGSPSDKAIWLLGGGAVAIVAGLFGVLRGRKGN